MLSALALGAIVICAPGAAVAQDLPFADIPPYILVRMNKEGTLDEYFKRFAAELARADFDGDGLTRSDLKIDQQVTAARQRASLAEKIMGADLDGDTQVTKDEARRVALYRLRGQPEDASREQQITAQVNEIMAMDKNGDGVVTLAEATTTEAVSASNRRIDDAEALLALDPDHDGRLTPEELKVIVALAFNEVDYDHDGRLTNAELALLSQAREVQRLIKEAGPCDLPQPPKADLVGILGLYGGVLQPDVTVAGQDETTQLVVLDIEPGDEPLYLVLSSFSPVIWDFHGATQRIDRVVAVRSRAIGDNLQMAGVGTAGLDPSKVTFLPPESCGLQLFWNEALRKQVATGTVEKAIGRHADFVYSNYDARTVALPSGNFAGGNSDRRVIYIADRGNLVVAPGQGANVKIIHGSSVESMIAMEDWIADSANLVEVDVASVVAPAEVERYQVLPDLYGIRQLVELGNLERTKDGYRIVKPFPRFPAELSFVTFFLPEGTPMPAGDPGGASKIILEPKTSP